MENRDREIAFVGPVLDGGHEKWAAKVTEGDRRRWEQFQHAANWFVGFVEKALGPNVLAPSQTELMAAFDAAAKYADGRDGYPLNERFGTFVTGAAGRNVAFMLHDVWERGPAVREWAVRRISSCPAQARWLLTRPVSELTKGRWDGPAPECWTRFDLVDGAKWEDWLQAPRMGVTPWAVAATTEFVAEIERNLATMPFPDAAELAHERVFQVGYRPRYLTMQAYVRHGMGDVSFCLRQLENYWSRFEELRAWAQSSRMAGVYGTNAYLLLLPDRHAAS